MTEPYYPDSDSTHEVEIGLLGHAGPYCAYDIDDVRAPIKEKDPPGFVRPNEYVKGGIVKKYKRPPRKR